MATMVLRRVGVLSFAKISGIVGAGLGLILGIIYGLIFMVAGAAMMSQSDGPGAGFGILGGLAVMVFVPVFYGVLMFIFGALYAVIYNISAGFVGGIEMEFESGTPEYSAPPPPPSQWAPNSYQSGQQM